MLRVGYLIGFWEAMCRQSDQNLEFAHHYFSRAPKKTGKKGLNGEEVVAVQKVKWAAKDSEAGQEDKEKDNVGEEDDQATLLEITL